MTFSSHQLSCFCTKGPKNERTKEFIVAFSCKGGRYVREEGTHRRKLAKVEFISRLTKLTPAWRGVFEHVSKAAFWKLLWRMYMSWAAEAAEKTDCPGFDQAGDAAG